MLRYLTKENRALLGELVRTDFKLRYQSSVLGYAWSLLRPLVLFSILYVIFDLVIKSGDNISHFPIYLLLGVVLWTFFTEMTSQCLSSIVNRGNLIQKIKIPSWIIVFSSSISALINLGLNLIVVAIAMVINRVHPMATLMYLPFILLEIYLFALGISLFLSAAFVRFRDMGYIWEVVLQLGFYATPILYAMSIIPVRFQKIQLLNPMAQAIQDARFAVVSHDPKVVTAARAFGGSWHELLPYLIVVVVLVSGFFYFRNQAKYFAENI